MKSFGKRSRKRSERSKRRSTRHKKHFRKSKSKNFGVINPLTGAVVAGLKFGLPIPIKPGF